MNFRPIFLAVVFLSLCGIGPAYAQFPPEYSIVPATPKDLERVILQVRSYGCVTGTAVHFDGTSIRVDIVDGSACFTTPPPFGEDVILGQFPAGTYPVVVYRRSSVDFSSQVVVTQRVTQRSAMVGSLSSFDLNDLWWDPQEPGAGLSIGQNASDQVFAVWNVYNASGQATWYTLQPGQWVSATAYTGPIYQTTGPYWGGPFDPTQVTIKQVGTGTVTFVGYGYATGTFGYTIDGVSGTKSISRLIQR